MTPVNTDYELLKTCSVLQPVTPTVEGYQAEFWNEGYGLIIKSIQNIHIDLIKEEIPKAKSKDNILTILGKIAENPNSFHSCVKEKNKVSFWRSPIGERVIKDWDIMFNRFLSVVDAVPLPNHVI